MIKVSDTKSLHPLKHAWKACTTVGRAHDLLRADLQDQLRFLQKEIGFRHIRFHASFHDELGIVHRDEQGRLQFRWSELDKIYDFLVEAGFDPIVELNPMPNALARGEADQFWYKMNSHPPKDFGEWEHFIKAFIHHFGERYGRRRLRNWLFELWNEPNLTGFWRGTQAEYFSLYAATVRPIKAYDEELKVGGPAGAGEGWNLPLLDYCKQNNLPIDFVSFHDYPAGEYCMFENRKGSPHKPGFCFVDHFEQAKKDLVDAGYGHIPVVITEWNTNTCDAEGKPKWVGSMQCSDLFSGAAACHYTTKVDPFVDVFGYWAASDVFFEAGPHMEPYGGNNQYYGMLNINGFPKPIFHAFKFLTRLEGSRMEITGLDQPTAGADLICTSTADATRLLLWNYHHPDEETRLWKDRILIPVPEYLQKADAVRLVLARLREGRGSALELWEQAGRPPNLTRMEADALYACSLPQYQFLIIRPEKGFVEIQFELKRNEVLFVELASAAEAFIETGLSVEKAELNRTLDYDYQ